MIEEPFSYWGNSWQRLKQQPAALWSLMILAVLFLLALIGPALSRYSYSEIHLEAKNLAPCASFWFGTDELGRDIFCRIWWGARISLFIGIAAAIIDATIGVIWGSVAAYRGGRVDEIMMRCVDVLQAIPYLLVVILLTAIRGSGIATILIAMTFTGWINMARICRSQILQLLELDYVAAARGFGAGARHIIWVHLIPNAIGPIVATLTLTTPTAIFTEAFLSFLGLGIQAPIASWGVMVNDGLNALRYYPWRLLFPAAGITITMLCFNLLGNALRDALDPRLRR